MWDTWDRCFSRKAWLGPVEGSGEQGGERSGSIKVGGGGFLEQLRDY
jgi:hypothetical protein